MIIISHLCFSMLAEVRQIFSSIKPHHLLQSFVISFVAFSFSWVSRSFSVLLIYTFLLPLLWFSSSSYYSPYTSQPHINAVFLIILFFSHLFFVISALHYHHTSSEVYLFHFFPLFTQPPYSMPLLLYHATLHFILQSSIQQRRDSFVVSNSNFSLQSFYSTLALAMMLL